jgi:hypothetical protein
MTWKHYVGYAYLTTLAVGFCILTWGKWKYMRLQKLLAQYYIDIPKGPFALLWIYKSWWRKTVPAEIRGLMDAVRAQSLTGFVCLMLLGGLFMLILLLGGKGFFPHM